ncbi:GNAT family N-acetyltransferase [Edaphobacter paludis]|uniref:GNAT family N-acetyltransferase n=1 Tax=Edaphobacter paludis TaxID=3035702 RepID=A0AAU7D7C2_9BACT
MIEIKPATSGDVLDSTSLIAEYAAECSIPAIGEINPQRETYSLMENAGLLHSFMVLENGEKIGFAMVVTPIMPHYGKRVASIESLFITKNRRRSGAGLELMRAVEQAVKQLGCVGILYSSPAGGQLERLLEASKAYQRTNAVFFRRFA